MACSGIRDGQSEQLGNMVSALQNRGTVHPDEPVILAGDFNESATEGMESRLGASHVSCEGNCRTHAHGELITFSCAHPHLLCLNVLLTLRWVCLECRIHQTIAQFS